MKLDWNGIWMSKYRNSLVGIAFVAIIGGIWGMSGGLGQEAKNMPMTEGITDTETLQAERDADLPIPSLSEDQIRLLDSIASCIKEENYQATAELLFQYENTLQYLFYQTMGGRTYLYQEGVLQKTLEGEGLVLRRPTAVFCGNFLNDMPEGQGVTLQVIELDFPRYDYAAGSWKQGKLEGSGVVGYHYYKGIHDGENQRVQKEGNFSQDLMNGAVVYSTTNSGGETTTWNLEAEAGATKIDDRWIYDEETQEYHLFADQDTNHAYVMQEADMEEKYWRNMLSWEE